MHFFFFFGLRTPIARRVKQPSNRLAGAPAPTGKSLLLLEITEHRATLPARRLETTKGEKYAHLYVKHTLYI